MIYRKPKNLEENFSNCFKMMEKACGFQRFKALDTTCFPCYNPLINCRYIIAIDI